MELLFSSERLRRETLLVSKFSRISRLPTYWVARFRAEATDHWTPPSRATVKIPPLFDGPTSWFKCEKLVYDWLDLTQLEAGKRGPALKSRLVGDASMYKGVLDRESQRGEDGVKYFKNTLGLRFIKGALSVFHLRFSLFIRAKREKWRWSSGLEKYHHCSSV